MPLHTITRQYEGSIEETKFVWLDIRQLTIRRTILKTSSANRFTIINHHTFSIMMTVTCHGSLFPQVKHYKRKQDQTAQMTKQTKELDRLPSWPPNSPDLNLIEIVWAWMVHDIAKGGWPKTNEGMYNKIVLMSLYSFYCSYMYHCTYFVTHRHSHPLTHHIIIMSEDLMKAVLRAWDNVKIESFIELVRSYKQRLLAIVSVDGDRHPSFA